VFTYTLVYNPFTGQVSGALRSDGANVPADPNNADWQAFLAWNAVQPVPLSLAPIAPAVRRQRRRLYDVFNDIGALTAAQKLAISNDLFGGSPPKFTQDTGDDAADLLVLYCLSQTGLSAADKNLVKQASAAIYARDNPAYLVGQTFGGTVAAINIPGDEPIP
jgi:hypothetical protein